MSSPTASPARRRATTFRRVGWLAVAAMTTVALLGPGSAGALAGSTNASVVFDQCTNGQTPPGPGLDCTGWINGILQPNNSTYAEDEATPQRVVLDIPPGGSLTRTITIGFQARKGGIHAYDSLTTWNLTQTAADRCQGLAAADCVGGSPSTFAVPGDPTTVKPFSSASGATSDHQRAGVFTLYGGTITGVSAYTHNNAAAATGDDDALVTITYTVAALPAKAMLLYGAHLVKTDIEASNGVIHVVDSVLLPK